MDAKEKLKELTNRELTDILINYKKYGYPVEFKNAALAILKNRGVPGIEVEKYLSHIIDKKESEEFNREKAIELINRYTKFSIITIILLICVVIMPVVFIFYINLQIIIIIEFVLIGIVLIFHFISIYYFIETNAHLNKQPDNKILKFIMYYIFSLPISPILYIISIIILRKQIKK